MQTNGPLPDLHLKTSLIKAVIFTLKSSLPRITSPIIIITRFSLWLLLGRENKGVFWKYKVSAFSYLCLGASSSSGFISVLILIQIFKMPSQLSLNLRSGLSAFSTLSQLSLNSELSLGSHRTLTISVSRSVLFTLKFSEKKNITFDDTFFCFICIFFDWVCNSCLPRRMHV